MKNEIVSIRSTIPEEAKILAKIQKAAFLPLYEQYHDAGNPYLRGEEDILRRIGGSSRYFTILYNGLIVGGIVYRLNGKRSPTEVLHPGEYYLNRVYIRPEYQSRGIARQAILLCEQEFQDAIAYYVDFPVDLEKNRRCYEAAGYIDTGERLCLEGSPTLCMMKKTVINTKKIIV